MKKSRWLIIGAILLVTAIVVAAALIGNETKAGLGYTQWQSDRISETFEENPNTFEAWIKFPKEQSSETYGGVMLGNFDNTEIAPCLNFEVIKAGQIKVLWTVQDMPQVQIFDGVNVYTGKWVHLAVVNDMESNTLSCYIDGKLAQTLEGAYESFTCAQTWVVGGDYRRQNTEFFTGEIHSIALYTDVRTAEEIKGDMTELSKEDLLAAWDLSQEPVDGVIADKSENGYNYHKTWYTEKTQTPYDYSFAVVGDTQIVNYEHPEKLACIYDWIVENKESKKIEYVMGLGDITDKSTPEEWENAATQISKLDGVVGYSLVRGNHDIYFQFNDAFKDTPYADSFDGQFDYKLENTWREVVAGEEKYLIFTLDIGPSEEVLAWAGNIISDHPDHKAIITTHVYLSVAGNYLVGESVSKCGGKNDAQEMWDKLFSKHENILMVICGHAPCDYVIYNRKLGEKGNDVIELLVDPQNVDNKLGATGMITLLNFSENGKKITVETISTVNGAYFYADNQYEIEIP